VIGAPGPAIAEGLGALAGGALRFAANPRDSLVVVGLALLAGLGGPERARTLVLVFCSSWLAGGILGAAFPGGGALPWATTVSFSIAGVLVAVDACPPRRWLAGLASAAGLVHGYADGAAIARAGGGTLPLLGACSAALLLAAAATALAVRLRTGRPRIVLRVAGSWIAAVGFLMLGWLARGHG
jgi:hydrogenase/urease accessory protein HupE